MQPHAVTSLVGPPTRPSSRIFRGSVIDPGVGCEGDGKEGWPSPSRAINHLTSGVIPDHALKFLVLLQAIVFRRIPVREYPIVAVHLGAIVLRGLDRPLQLGV